MKMTRAEGLRVIFLHNYESNLPFNAFKITFFRIYKNI